MQKQSNLFRSCIPLWLIFTIFASSLTQAQSASGPQYTIAVIGRLDGYTSNGSSGYGISPDGKVTGKVSIGAGATATTHAFIYQNGMKTDLGELGDYATIGSIGYSINANGQVAGSSYVRTSIPVRHAFLYSDGYMQDLGSLGSTESYGYGINANGDVTGCTTARSA